MNWYAVHTHPQGETHAYRHLKRQGFEVYLPRYLKKRSHARRIDWRPSPLFPRYLFVGMDIEKIRWRAIQSTVGVSHLVCLGDRPTPVLGNIIDTLRAQENDKGMVDLGTDSTYTRGDEIKILSGAFSEITGLFECRGDRDRVTLLLDLMGRRMRVQTSLGNIASVA